MIILISQNAKVLGSNLVPTGGGGGGDVVGAGPVTVDTIVRESTSDGKTIKGSVIGIDDDGVLRWLGTDGALRAINLTEVQRDALTPEAGFVVFNTDTERPEFYPNAARGWKGIQEAHDDLVLIQQKSDFPAPAAGVITLEAGKHYLISGAVNIGTDRIDWGAATAINGMDSAEAQLLYTGVGTMFTSADQAMSFNSVQLIAPNGSLFDFTSSGATESFIAHRCVMSPGLSLGTIAGCNFFVLTECFLTGATVSGFTVTGVSNNRIAFSFVEFLNIGGMALDIRSAIWNSIQIANGTYTTGAGDTFLIGDAASANIVESGGLLGNTFTGAGAPIAGITNCDLKWLFAGNADGLTVADTAPGIVVTMQTNATETVITDTTPVVIAGTFTVDPGGECKFSANAAGLVTHTGLVSRQTRIVANCRLLMASGGALQRDLTIGVSLNGTPIVDSVSLIRANTTDYGNVTVVWQIQDLAPADTLQLFVTNETDTANIIADALKFVIR